MKIIKLAAFTFLSTISIAHASNTITINFKNLDANKHETFYCTVQKAGMNDRVIGKNHAEMIKGFGDNGWLDTNVATLMHYAFDAYHDNKYSESGSVIIQVQNTKADLKCKSGTGNRPLIPGSYGL